MSNKNFLKEQLRSHYIGCFPRKAHLGSLRWPFLTWKNYFIKTWKRQEKENLLKLRKENFKAGLWPFKKNCLICFNESTLKMMKNVFYFILLKALFVLKIFKVLSWFFGHSTLLNNETASNDFCQYASVPILFYSILERFSCI